MCIRMFGMPPQVLQAMRDADASERGNQDAGLHAITASLGVACALLCVFSAYGVALHRDNVMSQVRCTKTPLSSLWEAIRGFVSGSSHSS